MIATKCPVSMYDPGVKSLSHAPADKDYTTLCCLPHGVSVLLKLSLPSTVVTTPQSKQHKIPSQDSVILIPVFLALLWL